MMFASGLALSTLARGGVAMVTAGPPSVAIFVAAISASGEAGAPIGSGAAGVAGVAISSDIAILVSAVLVSAIPVKAGLIAKVFLSEGLLSEA